MIRLICLAAMVAAALLVPDNPAQAQRLFRPQPRIQPPQQQPQQPAPTPQLQPQSQPRVKIDAQLMPFVRVTAGNSMGSGTVFFRDADQNCFVLTNYHVAGGKGSRCGIEFWTAEGKLLSAAPGVVVQAEIDDGWTDISVVRVHADQMPSDRIDPVPIAAQGSHVEPAAMITSCGSPGGTWQTLFRGQTFKADERRMEFHPRPGGGRSGSSVVVDGQIVGLLTWSNGRPSWENHSTDGMGYKSGYGIAQQVDTLWRVLKGQVSADTEARPKDYTPLVHRQYEPQISATVINETEQYVAFGVQVDEEAELRLRRRQQNQGSDDYSFDGSAVPDSDDARLLRDRHEPGPIRAGLRRIAMFAIVIAGLVVLIAYIGRKKGWWVVGGLLLAWPSVGCAQDAYQAEMQQLASRWTVESVSQETRWGSYGVALEKHNAQHAPLVILVTTDNCSACDYLKEQLARADQFGWLNHSACALVNASDDPRLARELTGGAQAFPVLVLYVPVPQEDGTYKTIRCSRVGTFPTRDEVDRLLAEREMSDSPQNLAAIPCPVTLEEFLAGAGVR